jgi:hypothetical protein
MGKFREVYIVLTDTGTLFTRMIKQFTRAPLNHASIGFDKELTEVYSFGRKDIHSPWKGGFVKENMYGLFFRQAKCAIFRCKVNEKQYSIMVERVRRMMEQNERYKYNLVGLAALWMNIRLEREDAFFCSHFVASLFELAKIPLVDKPAYWVSPGDIAYSHRVECIYKGMLNDYLHAVSMPMNIPDSTPALSDEARAV